MSVPLVRQAVSFAFIASLVVRVPTVNAAAPPGVEIGAAASATEPPAEVRRFPSPNALLNAPDLNNWDLSSMRRVMIGGAASSPELVQRVETAIPKALRVRPALDDAASVEDDDPVAARRRGDTVRDEHERPLVHGLSSERHPRRSRTTPVAAVA